MAEGTLYEGEKAIEFLKTLFENLDPERQLLVKLSGLRGKNESTTVQRTVSIAAFSESRRKSSGKLDELTDREGSVFYYGEEHPDHFLILKHGRKTMVFPLENAAAKRTGFADSVIRIFSNDWTKAAAVDIHVKSIFADLDGVQYFKNTITEKINNGSYTARLGKWASKKVFDRNLDKDAGEKLAIEEALKLPEEEILRTMIMGGDIQHLDFSPGDRAKEIPNSLKAKQAYNSTSIQFRDIVVEAGTEGKEIGTRESQSTYVYFIGTPFHAPSNLMIIRHRPHVKREG